jgi:hypothetical protein
MEAILYGHRVGFLGIAERHIVRREADIIGDRDDICTVCYGVVKRIEDYCWTTDSSMIESLRKVEESLDHLRFF